jgi:hypothetical protein
MSIDHATVAQAQPRLLCALGMASDGRRGANAAVRVGACFGVWGIRLLALVVFIAVVLGAPCTAAAQQAEPAYLAPNSRTNLEVRLGQLRSYVDLLSQTSKLDIKLSDPDAFCRPFANFDIQRTTHKLWGELSRIPRRELIAHFARYVARCGYSAGAGKRAGFFIDLLYWNRLEDTLGYTTTDVLLARDVFYEVYINQALQLQLRRNEEARQVRGLVGNDFLDAAPMARVDLFKSAGDLLSAFSPNQRRVFNVMLELVDFREGYLTPFGPALLRILSSPDDRRVVTEFYAYMHYARVHRELLAEPHGGYHRLLRATHGDQEQAMRIYGVLGALLYMPIEDLAPALATRARLTPEVTEALYEGSMAYYLINELDELAARPDASDRAAVRYHFFYPDGFETPNWKWYHFYNQAYVGCELHKRHFPDEAIVAGARLMAVLYEGTTLNLAIPSRGTLSVEPRAVPILESAEDVVLNAEGAGFGVRMCRGRFH